MKTLWYYVILSVAAVLMLMAWRKWAVELQGGSKSTAAQANQMRIISASPNITEILFELGLDDSVAGVTDFCNYPQKAESKPSIGTIMEPDIETILKLAPTAVFVTNTAFHKALGMKLEGMGLRVNVFDVDTMRGIEETIYEIGLMTGRAEQAVKLNKDIYHSLEQIRGLRPKYAPKVLIVIQPEPLIVAGPNTYIDEILTIAGGQNAITDTDRLYPMINNEMLLLIAPDIIIETRQNEIPRRDAAALEHYKVKVPAVKNNNVFVVDADIMSRPGPRVTQAAKQMQQIILISREAK